MSMGWNVREVYARGLKPFDLGLSARELLCKIVTESCSLRDYENAIRTDRLLTTHVVRAAASASRIAFPSSLSQCVSVIGEDYARDFVIGHSLKRSKDPTADRSTKPESIRDVLVRSHEAESKALDLNNPNPAAAYTVGLLFDIIECRTQLDRDVEPVFRKTLSETWHHSLLAGEIVWALALQERIDPIWQRWIMAAALAHDFGKLVLFSMYPRLYLEVLERCNEVKKTVLQDDGFEAEIEMQLLGISHCEIGSFLTSYLMHLNPIEEVVDFHHQSKALKARNPSAYQALSLLRMADQLSFAVSMKNKLDGAAVDRIIGAYREDYPYRAGEIGKILVTLRAKKLLS